MEKIETKCSICGKKYNFDITEEQYNKYIDAEKFIQNIFPEFGVIEREMLITCICDECRNKFFYVMKNNNL